MIATGAAAAENAPSLPAVDGVNGKIESLGGSYAKKGLFGVAGALSIPLANQFGAQIDAGAGSFAGRFLGSFGGHLFWRDPRQGLVGVYGNYTRWDQWGGVHVARVGLEGEAYLGRWSLSGIAGAESGNNSPLNGTFAIPSGFITPAGSLTNVTRFFDRATLAYYITDNWKASVGHRYTGGAHALALGTEYALPAGRGVMASLFAEARLGQGSNNRGAWGGLRVYFGNSDKTLIRRHREDDPELDFTAENMFGIAGSIGPTTTTGTCTGEFVFNGSQCVSGGGGGGG